MSATITVVYPIDREPVIVYGQYSDCAGRVRLADTQLGKPE